MSAAAFHAGPRSSTQRLLGLVAAACCLATPTLGRDGDSSQVAAMTRLFSGLPHKVVVQAPYAYLGLDSGVEVVDVSVPSIPVAVGHVYLPSPAYDLQLLGGNLFVANGESGLSVVSVADPANPSVVGRLDLPPGSGAEARGIAVAAGVALLAESGSGGSSDHGLRVVDVANPTLPVQLGRSTFDNGAMSVAVSGATAFVGLGSTLAGRLGVIAVDVSNPATPVELGGSFVNLGLPVNQIEVEGTVAFVATGDKSAGALVTIQISNPSSPLLLDYEALRTGAMGLSLGPGVLYAAIRESGVVAYDRASPAALSRLGALALGPVAVAVTVSGSQVLAGLRSSNGAGGLFVLDAGNPVAMTMLGASTHAEATAAAAAPSLAFLLRRDGLTVLDTTAPSAPIAIGSWTVPGADLNGIDVDGDVVVISEGRDVHVLDVATPGAPLELSLVTVADGVAMRPVLRDGTLYVVTGSGLEVFSLGFQAAPTAGGTIMTAGASSGFAVDGDYGYLVAGDQLIVLDLTTPTSPAVLHALTIAGDDLLGVAASGALAVVTGARNRLYTVDVSNPASPQVSAVVGGGRGVDVRLIGDRAVVAAGRDGVRVFDVSNVNAPIEEGFFDTSGEVNWLANEGGTLYLAAVAAQHWVAQCTTCASACIDAHPSVLPNSLRMVKVPTRDALSWQIASGTGASNVHRTDTKSALGNLFADMGTMMGSSTSTTFIDAFDPAPRLVAHYRVFGAGDCTGISYP